MALGYPNSVRLDENLIGILTSLKKKNELLGQKWELTHYLQYRIIWETNASLFIPEKLHKLV